MPVVWKLFRGARAAAAWTSLLGAASLVFALAVDQFGRRSAIPRWAQILWFVLSLVVALGAGIFALPRWQALLAVAVSVGMLVFLFY
jgi:hypothetical protein